MIISYCSQIKNRFHQLRETFSHNLEKIRINENVEWIIVDCGSSDGLSSFMNNFINSPDYFNRIHYYRALNLKSYSIPIAKNFSARISSGEYLFNLDVDNFIGDTTQNIINIAPKGICCNIFKKGVYGRIGSSREIFKKVGGYDESFLPAGKHDTDLKLRCQLIGYEFIDIPCGAEAILNSKDETIKNTRLIWKIFGWKFMNLFNKQKMEYNLKNKIYCPNKKFASCEFEYNFKTKVSLSKETF
jgi:predicted glycosyltransferase involved in capsule biosynthesis